jgi:hypothetical protein
MSHFFWTLLTLPPDYGAIAQRRSDDFYRGEFREAEGWAVSAADALQPGYESYRWRQFLDNSTVKGIEDPIIQQLKFSVLTVLMEMDLRDRELQNLFRRLNQQGQFLWLAPTAPWLVRSVLLCSSLRSLLTGEQSRVR